MLSPSQGPSAKTHPDYQESDTHVPQALEALPPGSKGGSHALKYGDQYQG